MTGERLKTIIERSQRKVDEANRRVIDFVLKG